MLPSALHPAPITGSAQPRGRFAFGLTRRALILLAAGFLWLIPGYYLPRIAYVMLLWDALILLAAILDGLRLPNPSTITASRAWLSAPCLGTTVEIELTITHTNRILLDFQLIDDLPPQLLETPATHQLRAYPHAPATLRYALRPRERGDVQAGALYLRYRSTVGLVSRWAVAPLAQPIRIYPELRTAEDQQLFLAKSRQIEQQLRQLRHRGLGREFESLREYRTGDDLRDVCWTASARRGDLVTRQYQAERSQSVWIVLDTGRLMRAQIRDRASSGLLHSALHTSHSKLDYACSTAPRPGTVSPLLRRPRWTPRLRPYHPAAALAQPWPRPHAPIPRIPRPAPCRTLRSRPPPRHGHPRPPPTPPPLILWITDLAESAMRPEVIDGAAQLLHRHVVLFVAMAQPEVASIARAIPATIEEMFRSVAAQEMATRRELLLARLRDQGAITLDTLPSQMTVGVLNHYLSIKERSIL